MERPPPPPSAPPQELPSTSASALNPGMERSPRPDGYSIAKSLLAGGIAGGLSRTAVAPLERLKILMQVQGNVKVYRGVWQGLVHMGKTEGLKGMFRGNWANCVRIIPNSAIKFFTYETISREISDRLRHSTGSGEMQPVHRLLAGAGAGIIAMSLTYPLDMVRGRLTVQVGQAGKAAQYKGMVHATTSIVAQEGLGALYKGWVPSVIGVIPYVGLNFAVYETAKAQVLKTYGGRDERDINLGTRLACGALAGSVGQTVAYPFDVARRRLQVSGWTGSMALHTHQGSLVVYSGMTDCFVRTVREEGVRALFKGLWPNYLKVVPSIAIAFVTYEQAKEALGVEFRISE